VPVVDTQYRRVFDSPPQDPVPTLILLDTDEGRFVQIGTDTSTMKQISTALVALELALLAYAVLGIVSIVVYAPFWILGSLRSKTGFSRERRLQALPLVSVIGMMASGVVLQMASDDPIAKLGNVTAWSVALSITTVMIAAAAVASVVALWRTPREAVRASVRRFSLGVTVALLLVSAYLAYWGVVGIRTWS
jgi:hypothetical protein